MMLAQNALPAPSTAEGPNVKQILATRGYLVLDQIADSSEVKQIRQICQGLFDRKAGFNEGKHFDMVGTDFDGTGPKLPQILHPSIYAPELRHTRFFAKAEALAHELLGANAHFAFDHVIKKPAFDGAATPWHQDEAFRDPTYDYEEISIWMPLQPVNEENGCMAYIPGANPKDVLPHRSPNGNINVHGVECYAGFDPNDAVTCPIQAGGCTVHTGRTVHGAGANHTDAPRYAYILVFDLPRRRRRTPRKFPWLDEKKTARMERERAWRHSLGGLFVRAGRKLHHLTS
jgi:ectoine hydroxylase-related dioxygenase (phytanoyl-CoA dioxygenase family)